MAEELSVQVARQYEAVSELKATVMMSAILGNRKKGNLEEISGIPGYILLRKPSEIRISGSSTLVPLHIFDLVSNGVDFRLSIPGKKLFVTGTNEAQGRSSKPIENLRPQHLVDAILPKPADPANETAVLDDSLTDGCYILRLQRTASKPQSQPSRTLWIDRTMLRVSRELISSSTGTTLTDARYSQWQESEGVIFPRHIEINRPQDECLLVIRIQTLKVNDAQLSSEMFVLEQPPGTQVRQLDGHGKLPLHDTRH